jgi:transposase
VAVESAVDNGILITARILDIDQKIYVSINTNLRTEKDFEDVSRVICTMVVNMNTGSTEITGSYFLLRVIIDFRRKGLLKL